MGDYDQGFSWGMFVGGVIMVVIWTICALVTEISKVNSGYLTHGHKTYTVTLYDELRIPGEEAD